MSDATRSSMAAARQSAERRQAWTAALLTALLHGLLVLLVLLSPPLAVTDPQGSTGGSSSLDVTWIDETLAPPPPSPAPPARTPAASAPSKAAPAPARVRSTLVTDAADPVPPDDTPDAPPDSVAMTRAPESAAAPDDAAQREAQAQAAAAPPAQRPARMRGMPPGMRMEDLPRANPGPAPGAGAGSGRGDARASGTSLEVEGYQVQYEPLNERLLAEWRDRGMTEIFLPLPGSRRYMVCPLEIALRRGSGPCRMVEQNAPELADIGDAREVILMQRVYKLGDVVWSGPGPYR